MQIFTVAGAEARTILAVGGTTELVPCKAKDSLREICGKADLETWASVQSLDGGDLRRKVHPRLSWFLCRRQGVLKGS